GGGGPAGVLRVGRERRRPSPHLRLLADLRLAAIPPRRERKREALRPVARPRRSGLVRQRGVRMTATGDGPSVDDPNAMPPSQWRLPRPRVDVDGDWFDDDVLITHAGILANLRSLLRPDTEGYFIQTRGRIPGEVQDVPLVGTRLERPGGTPHAFLDDGPQGAPD